MPAGGHENCPLTVTGSARHDCVASLPPVVEVPPRVRLRCEVLALSRRNTVKSAGEIMEVLEAFDLTGSYRDAATLAGCSHHTVARYVAAREAGGQLKKAASRPQLIDEFVPKVQEWVKHSKDAIRADKHEHRP